MITSNTAADIAFRTAQDESRPVAERMAAAAAFQVLTLEDVAASMDIPAETLKARRAELVSSNAATLSIVEEMTQRDAERAILAEVRKAEEFVADRERREARRARQAEMAANDQAECSRCGGQGGSKSWPGFTCFRCDGSGVDPKPLSEIEASVEL